MQVCCGVYAQSLVMRIVSSWCRVGLSGGKSDDLLLGTEREINELLLHLLILECLRLTIISMSE